MNTRAEQVTIAILTVLLVVWFVVPWVVQLIVYIYRWL